jgi:hypothetical protein
MSLWARFTARRKARKAERKAIADRKLHDRMEAQASPEAGIGTQRRSCRGYAHPL